MVIADRRDPVVVAERLTRWLRAKYPAATAVEVPPLKRPSAGLSSETFLVEASWTEEGSPTHRSLVARLPPSGEGLFPVYDLASQALVQEQLLTTAIPVAAPLAMEDDAEWLGAPFLLMERVPGRVLLDNPPFLREGWLHDASPGDQRDLHSGFVDVLADIHRLDWAALGLAGVGGGGQAGLATEVGRWATYLDWAMDGAPSGIVADALAWCTANRPEPEPPASLLWGDVRFGNVVYDRALRPAAVLDWEMVSIGPAEVDLGWFQALHALSAEAAGGDLPGFPGATDTVAAYEKRLGREVTALGWYEVFALARSAAIMVRVARLLASQGIDDSWLAGNPMLARLRAVVR